MQFLSKNYRFVLSPPQLHIYFNATKSPPRSPSPSANALLKVQNLLYPDSEPEREMLNNQRAPKSDNLQAGINLSVHSTPLK